MLETTKIHTIRPDLQLNERPLLLGTLMGRKASPALVLALLGDGVEQMDQHPAYYDGIEGLLFVDRLAIAKGADMNPLASDIRTRALRRQDPESQDGRLLCGKAVLVLFSPAES